MDEPTNMVELARALAEQHLQQTDAVRLATIVAAYDRALLDSKTQLPTYLHAAIEAARKKA